MSIRACAAAATALLVLAGSSGCGDGDDAASRERDRLVELIATNMRTVGLEVEESEVRCVAEGMVERIGLDPLSEVRDADDFAALDPKVQDDMIRAATAAIEDCGIEVGPDAVR